MKFCRVLASTFVVGTLMTGANQSDNRQYSIIAEASTLTGETTVNLNLRTGAGTDHHIIRTLARGTRMNILSESSGWMHVRIGSEKGWVSAQYVRMISGDSGSSSTSTRTGVTTARLNMRTGAGTAHNIMRTLPLGENLTILSESNGWMSVRVGNQQGWVSAEWVRVTNSGSGTGNSGGTTPGNDNNVSTSTRTGVTIARLNMRTGAGTNHSIIRTLPLGENLTILSESNGWMRVRAGTQEGWVSAEWVSVTGSGTDTGNSGGSTPGNDNNSSTEIRHGQTTANLNLRRGAGTNHPLIRTLPMGTNLTILSESNGWMHVRAGNDEGFVSAQHVRIVTGDNNVGEGTTILNFFPDRALAEAVANTLKRQLGSTVTQAELRSITELHASFSTVQNLEGIQYLTNLTGLWLNQNSRISDLTPLENLTNLRTLNIAGNNISDLGPLSNLRNLENLTLSSNGIKDVTLLVNLTNLTVLWLNNNNISDVRPLANLTNLEWLWLNNNYIRDLTPLNGLTGTNISATNQSIN